MYTDSHGDSTMSKLHVNEIVEATAGHGIHIPGALIQTVQNTTTTEVTANNITSPQIEIDTGLDATITPKFATSKILILAEQSYFWSSDAAQGVGFNIWRGSTKLTTYNFYASAYSNNITSTQNRAHGYKNLQYIDTAGTTSPINYRIGGAYWEPVNSWEGIKFQHAGTESPSNIILMEIAQ